MAPSISSAVIDVERTVSNSAQLLEPVDRVTSLRFRRVWSSRGVSDLLSILLFSLHTRFSSNPKSAGSRSYSDRDPGNSAGILSRLSTLFLRVSPFVH